MTQELPPAEPFTVSGQSSRPPDGEHSLKQAIRRARFDDAERVGVQTDLRASQIVRLEMLQEALKPLLAQIPSDSEDFFDVGIMPGTTPRLFIDVIGFVEMGRDSHTYRLLQDARHGRLTIAESAEVPTMVNAVTEYVARRLLDREKALASDARAAEATTQHRACSTSKSAASATSVSPKPESGGFRRRFGAVFAFIIDLLGAVTFFAILAVGAWYLWNRFHGRV